MNEEAELDQYGSVLCSCTDVINALVLRGSLTVAEQQRARAYLSIQEPDNPDPHPLPTEAKLYLDSLSLGALYHCGVLQKLAQAGFETFVSARATSEHDALLAHPIAWRA
jgi:hypothetical protein